MHSRQAKPTIIRWISTVLGLFVFLAGCATSMQQPGAKSAQSPQTREITRIEVKSLPESEEIDIQASGKLDYTSVKQTKPLGVIFYFPQTRLGKTVSSLHPKGGIVRAIDLSTSEDQKNVRMEVALEKDLSYAVNKKADGLTVIFYKTAPGARQPETRKTEPAAESRAVSGQKKQGPGLEPVPAEKAYSGPAAVRSIEFSSGKAGESTVAIGTSRPVDYRLVKTGDRMLKLRLKDARLPEHIDRRPLITTRFDSAVDRVIPYESPAKKEMVEVLIELREAVPYRIEREDGRLLIHFEASTVGPRPYPVADLPDWQEVLEKSISEAKTAPPARLQPAEAGVPEKAEYPEWLFEKEEYTGQKIALDFYETDIKNVFRILQQVSGKNYAIDPDVRGKVTISMEKPVPWDQVLDLILKQNGLGNVEHGNIIRIATRETLRKEEEARQAEIEAYKKRLEQQKAMEPLVTQYIPVNYANAQAEVLPHVKDILSERGKVNVDSRNNQLIITDTEERIAKAEEVIEQIDKVTPQVVIEARIVEINEDFLKDIGTEFVAQSEDVFRSDLGGNYSYNVAMNHPSTNAASSIGFNFTRLPNLGTPLVLDAKLTALEEENNVKIVSAPKIVTLDNKKATIKQGFEIPYQTVEDDEVNIEFKEVDLRLEVTPHVTPDRRISLSIYVTKNEVAELTLEAPALSTNEATTELLVDDGDTIVIGGIKKDTTTTKESGFPILKDIPILGWAFKRDVKQNEKSELLIFMTPRIVQLEQREFTAVAKE